MRQSDFEAEFRQDLTEFGNKMAREVPESEVRQRGAKSEKSSSKSSKPTGVPSTVEDSSSRVISLLDVVRVLLTLLAASAAVSYYVTSGESFTFKYQPWFTRPAVVQQYLQGPLKLTPEELAKYDGSNPDLPIYLAVNGTIFDVSQGRHTYGPGGGYNVFAGRDATRAFVTGCFREDQTNDLRGAEKIYLPVEDLEDEIVSSGERKTRAEREKREAKKRVTAEVKKWVDFYGNSQKYFEVGKVVGQKEPAGPSPPLCATAEKGRPKRSKMQEKDGAAAGKPVR